MVWGAISLMGSTEIIFIEGSIDAVTYQKVLKIGLEPLARKIAGNWSFQQDNARPHTAASTKAWLAGHALIPKPLGWPPYSPDGSPIENLWSVLQRDVDSQSPKNLDELRSAIVKCWNTRTRDGVFMEGLLGEWGERVTKLIARGGDSLQY